MRNYNESKTAQAFQLFGTVMADEEVDFGPLLEGCTSGRLKQKNGQSVMGATIAVLAKLVELQELTDMHARRIVEETVTGLLEEDL